MGKKSFRIQAIEVHSCWDCPYEIYLGRDAAKNEKPHIFRCRLMLASPAKQESVFRWTEEDLAKGRQLREPIPEQCPIEEVLEDT